MTFHLSNGKPTGDIIVIINMISDFPFIYLLDSCFIPTSFNNGNVNNKQVSLTFELVFVLFSVVKWKAAVELHSRTSSVNERFITECFSHYHFSLEINIKPPSCIFYGWQLA